MFTTANYKGACITDPDIPLLHGVNVVLCAWCYGSPLFAIDILFLLRLHLPRIFMTNRAPSSCVRLPCRPVSHLCRPDPDSATNNPATLIIATWRVLSALVAEITHPKTIRKITQYDLALYWTILAIVRFELQLSTISLPFC